MLAERTLALIGTQRSYLQDNWVQAKRKGRRGQRIESKEKAGFTRGLESRQGRRKSEVAWGEVAWGEAGQGRVE